MEGLGRRGELVKMWDKGCGGAALKAISKWVRNTRSSQWVGSEAKAVIVDCQPLSRFVDVTGLPLAKMEFAHELKEEKDGLYVTHRAGRSRVR
ncbi:MAG: hypothetical protein U0Z26_19470 [Anaerolineales bacterium]